MAGGSVAVGACEAPPHTRSPHQTPLAAAAAHKTIVSKRTIHLLYAFIDIE
jgi:hypothetical protein